MRLATAYDEIAPLKDPRVQANPGYLVIILLSRVIIRLGEVDQVTTKVVENLFAADLAYLQDMYQRINQTGHNRVTVTCPHCEGVFEVELEAGGMTGYPSDRLFEEVAYVSYHFHWPYDQVMQLDHLERQRWVAEIARINRRVNETE